MRRRAVALFFVLLTLFACLAPQALAAPSDWDENNPGALLPDHLYAQSAVLIDAETGDVLFDKDSLVRMYPASTTKMMTLLLALESDIPLDQEIVIPEVAENVPSDSSLVPVYEGERMTFQDLLYGTMLHSGNDGANAIAYLVGGSIAQFVDMMNERAAQIGCTGTHFSNAHGYHDETHYSTAHDLALIAQEGMRNETFRQIVSAATYTMAPTVNRGAYNLTNTAAMVNPASQYYYEGCVGIKTGFHSRAGQCFVGALERDGVSLISVVLGAGRTSDDVALKWEDTEKLFEYGLSQYQPYLLTDLFEASGRNINTVSIANAAEDDAQKGLLELRLSQLSDDSYTVRIRTGNEAMAEALADFAANTQITYNEGLRAPIDEGQIVGTLTYTAPDGTVITGMLSAERAMQARPEHASIYDVLPFLLPLEPFFSSGFAWVALALVVLVIFILLIHRARKKAATNRRRAAVYRAKRRAYDHAEAERRRAEAQQRLTERQRRQRAANAQRRPAPRPQGQQRPQSAPRKRPGPRDDNWRY